MVFSFGARKRGVHEVTGLLERWASRPLTRFCLCSRGLASSAARPPVFELRSIEGASSTLPRFEKPWVIQDHGSKEVWAVVGPAVESGARVKSSLICLLLGRHSSKNGVSIAHPFLREMGKLPSQAMQHVSFSTRLAQGSQDGAFVDYSARYGAIRMEDKVTLYESLLERFGVYTGNIANMHVCPDPLAADEGRDTVGKVKWASEAARAQAVKEAHKVDAEVRRQAQSLNLDGELLHRPLIALSNGQTRRARILAALLAGGECIVMEEPYTGLDPDTRRRVSTLLASLHSKQTPRIILILREQEALPDFVTHILRIGDGGEISYLGPVKEESSLAGRQGKGHARGGYHVVEQNASRGVGVGDISAKPVVEMSGVEIAYRGKKVLSNINLQLQPESRTILVGDNGSGKTTLLSLLLGDHPLSYAFPASKLSLFGAARRDRINATANLNARIGHFSPELFNAFPRRSLEAGGLSVADAIASGFANIFTPRPWGEQQLRRVHGLLAHFADLLRNSSPSGSCRGKSDVDTLARTAFRDLSTGSQAVVLFLRAIVHSPTLLVLDEPFQGMDRRQVERARLFLDEAGTARDGFLTGASSEEKEKDREARKAMAMIVVSHYEEEWPTSCGKLIRLKDGEIAETL